MPVNVSSRVLRLGRGVSRASHYDEAWPWGLQREPLEASAGRWKAGALSLAAALCGLRAGGGRTGAMGWANRVVRSSSGHRQPLSL